MQRLSYLFLFFLMLQGISNLTYGQEAMAPAGTYFQGEVIRKVSVGADGVWVIKGADSTGLARLDFQGVERDYGAALAALGSPQPLIGIVGKYSQGALFATAKHGLYRLEGETISAVDLMNGATRIYDLKGTTAHTRVATDKGLIESYDNQSFTKVTTIQPQFQNSVPLKLGVNSSNLITLYREYSLGTDLNTLDICFDATADQDPYGRTESSAVRINMSATPFKGVHAVGGAGFLFSGDNTAMVGDKTGLYVNTWVAENGNTSSLKNRTFIHVKDTTVYALHSYDKNYSRIVLLGTEKGLLYYKGGARGAYSGKTVRVDLGEDYVVYDIAVEDESQTIWLATDKGLLKVVDHHKAVTNYQNNSLLWAKTFAGQQKERAFSTITDAQGNVYQTGYFTGSISFGSISLSAQNGFDYFLAKLNKDGSVEWVRTAQNTALTAGRRLDEEGYRLSTDSQGNVYVLCKLYAESASAVFSFGPGFDLRNSADTQHVLLKYSSSGELLSMKPLSGFVDHATANLAVDEQDFLYISYQEATASTTNPSVGRKVIKYDAAGDLLWEKNYPLTLDKFNLGQAGKFYLSGPFSKRFHFGSVVLESESLHNLAILHFDHEGEIIWSNHVVGYYEMKLGVSLREIGFDHQGNTYLGGTSGSKAYFGNFSTGEGQEWLGAYYFLTKINQEGQYVWVRSDVGQPYNIGFKDMVVDAQGNCFITGNYEHSSLKFGGKVIAYEQDGIFSKQDKIYVVKFDTNGGHLWSHAFSEVYFKDHQRIGKSLALAEDGVLLSAALVKDVVLNGIRYEREGEGNIFLAKLSNTFTDTYFNLVKGRSFIDQNNNQQYDEGEPPIEGNIIKAEPGPFYAKTDFNGRYILKLGEGAYTIDQVIPRYAERVFTQTFPKEAYSLQFDASGGLETGFDFAHTVDSLSYPEAERFLEPANLTFDVSSNQFRRCFEGNTTVYIRNDGDLPAEFIKVVVVYPEHITPISSSLPWVKQEENVLTFNISSIPARGTYLITITGEVSCEDESIRNMQQCVKAFVNFSDPTKTDSRWDKSDLELTAECKDNGFVRLNMKNNGAGHMADSAIFSVYLDQQKVYTGKYKLAAAEALSLNLLANEKPLLFKAELSPFHPQKKSVSLQIADCATTAGPQLTHSYETILPADTLLDNQKEVCLPITDSFDPNDKLAMPVGVTDNHNILGNEYITYTIRFQNTGTAPAINVRIVDVLDDNLDLATLKVGATSHPASWQLLDRTLEWRFSNIYLPDSTTNEPASHGFVKLYIKPKKGLSKGTVLKNSAGIYFDFNSPVITNEVFHTIGLPDIQPGERMVVQPCNTTVSLLHAPDQELLLCGDKEYLLSQALPASGSGMWRVSRGGAKLADPYAYETLASNLSVGENEFFWEVTYCDQQVSSRVTIIRQQAVDKPVVAAEVPICQEEPLPHISASGEGIAWYADAALTSLLSQEASYQPTARTQTLYVVQRNEHCISEPALVEVVLHQKPEPPQVNAVQEACLALEKPLLQAQGASLRWYGDATGQQLLGEGETLQLQDGQNRSYWVSQSNDYCESSLAEVSFRGKYFDERQAYIANMVTPNGDDKNQLYYLKPFYTQECLGLFYGIKIFNRWGHQVFESKEEDFRWDASHQADGVYFFQMHYQLKTFRGHIQVLR